MEDLRRVVYDDDAMFSHSHLSLSLKLYLYRV